MVAKLSSVRTIAAASLATSLPVTPIATPISACFNAGASFTPSPVIATIFPFSCHARTIRILCSGETLAYTEIPSTKSFSSSSDISSITAPSQASDSSFKMPILFAIAAAVILWSPVIMIGRIPARLHSSTASLDSSLGGSIIAIRPINISWSSSSVPISFSSSICLYANARTLKPSLENCMFWTAMSSRSESFIFLTVFPTRILSIRSNRTSTAPFTIIICPS